MSEQEGDVVLYQSIDDGEITVENGLIRMSGGLNTAAYLSLFGGNEQDGGSDDTTEQWWGNIGEVDPAKQYRSETQYLLRSLPLSVNNLRRVEKAANRDLAWMVTVGAATEVTAVASVQGLNKLKLAISITADGVQSDFEFIENWGSTV